MRYIQKTSEPSELTSFRARIPRPSFDDLSKQRNVPIKDKIRKSLLKEQGRICCYCGQRISFNSGITRIEHLLPQSVYPTRDLDYSNLLCSCYGGVVEGVSNPKSKQHCDPHKDNDEIPITPLMTDCENFFWFDDQGYIWPQPGNINAQNTIKILNLNTPALVIKRKYAISALHSKSPFNWDHEYLKIDKLDCNGFLNDFCFVLKSYIKNFIMAKT